MANGLHRLALFFTVCFLIFGALVVWMGYRSGPGADPGALTSLASVIVIMGLGIYVSVRAITWILTGFGLRR